jgi:hypothetical protein
MRRFAVHHYLIQIIIFCYYIMVDGVAVNTRLEDKQGSGWRENRLGLVFNSGDLRKRKEAVRDFIMVA